MNIEILSLFSDAYFLGLFKETMVERGCLSGRLRIRYNNIRDFAVDKRQVDDRPYGGGPGMVLKPEPIAEAIKSVRKKDSYVVYLSPQGKRLTAEICHRLAHVSHLILLCGHYEGIDERILKRDVDEEISIGDYVLTNGALPAVVLVDAVARFIPGVLGNDETVCQDSFEKGIFDAPHYTRPEVYRGDRVPPVLMKGNFKEIDHWRQKEALQKTKEVRPELYLYHLTEMQEGQPPLMQGNLGIVLWVKDLKKSAKFYYKMFDFKPLEESLEKVVFPIGQTHLILKEGDVHDNSLFHLSVDSYEAFERMAVRMQKRKRMIGKLEKIIKSGEEIVRMAVVDLEGHQWVISSSLRKEENNE